MRTRGKCGVGNRVELEIIKRHEPGDPAELEAILSLAKDQDYQVDEDLRWMLAESGNLRERQGFKDALAAASAGAILRVYVYSVDRLGRNLLEMLIFLRQLEELDVETWEAERRRRLSWDDFILQIEGAVAGKERQEILRRTQDGLRRAIHAGKYSGGIVAYGYRVDPVTKELEIDEAEASVVRLIFEWTTDEQLSCPAIADRLGALGVPTRYQLDGRLLRRPGKRSREKTAGIWRPGRVLNMLKNRAYMGEWSWGKRSKKRKPSHTIPGKCPAIVSKDTFMLASTVLENHRWKAGHPAVRQYLLRSKIKCLECGKTYVGTVSRVARGEKRYYRCTGATKWQRIGCPKCPGKSLNADYIEDAVWAEIKAFIHQPEVALAQLQQHRRPVDEDVAERLAETEAQIADLDRQERNALLIAAQSREADPRAVDDVLREIKGSRAALEGYKHKLKERLAVGDALERELAGVASRLRQLRDLMDKAGFAERRRAVLELVKSIEVASPVIAGQRKPVVTVTYRFSEPAEPQWGIDPSPLLETARVAERVPRSFQGVNDRYIRFLSGVVSSGMARLGNGNVSLVGLLDGLKEHGEP